MVSESLRRRADHKSRLGTQREPSLTVGSLFCGAKTDRGLSERGLSESKKTQNGELLAEIAVVNFNCDSAADDFILGRKWFSISWLIVCHKKAV